MMMHRCLQVQGHGHCMILVSMLVNVIAFLEVIDYLLGGFHVRHKRCLQLQNRIEIHIVEALQFGIRTNLLTLDVRFINV